jgi:hypothetical protein
MRKTSFLDKLRERSIFIPMGKGQGHHCKDSLNAELTGIWTPRYTLGGISEKGYYQGRGEDTYKEWPKTVIEYLQEAKFDIFTCIGTNGTDDLLGSMAGRREDMSKTYFKNNLKRIDQFNYPSKMSLTEWIEKVKNSKKFYAHIFLRNTHRPWGQKEELLRLARMEDYISTPRDRYLISAARSVALSKPIEFAELRRRGLEKTDKVVNEIFEATKHMADTTYIVYSNHGEVFDHFRYVHKYNSRKVMPENVDFIEGTSHANFPYEVLYANMQMWIIPGQNPIVMKGCGRSIDIAPTILELAGVSHGSMDGESMIPNFASGVFDDRDRYAEVPGHCVSMVRKDGYKFLSRPSYADHIVAVFDLKTDPYEYVNLAKTPQGEEVIEWAIQKYKSLK